jgi:hypothetical protein
LVVDVVSVARGGRFGLVATVSQFWRAARHFSARVIFPCPARALKCKQLKSSEV